MSNFEIGAFPKNPVGPGTASIDIFEDNGNNSS
jgi:hypothetical protein